MTETLEHTPAPAPDTSTEELPARHRTFLLAVLVGAAAALWLTPLASSFWLDETATYWVVRGSLSQLFHRALQYQSGSIPYFLIAWVAHRIGGTSEVVMRLPSVIIMSVGTLLLYRLAKRLFDGETALLAGVVFVSSGGIAFAAADARPYALAITLLIGATLSLVRYLDEPKARFAVAYALLAALTVYTHYLFALALAAHIPYALARKREGDVRTKQLLAAFLGAAALLFPAALYFGDLLRRRSVLSVPAPVTVDGLLRIWVPAVLVVGIAGGTLVATAGERVFVRPAMAAKKAWVLVILWLLLPPLTLYGVSAFTSSQILATRYFLSAIPALALLAGWGIRAVRPAPARQVVALVVALLSILAYARPQHGLWFEGGVAEDWRGAAVAERALVTDPNTPVLVQAGFIESSHIGWVKNPEKRAYLLSPLSIYPMTGHVIPLPYRLNRSAENYLVPVTNRDLLSTNRFLLVTRVSFDSYLPWFDGRLRGAGFESRSAGEFGSVTLVVFERH